MMHNPFCPLKRIFAFVAVTLLALCPGFALGEDVPPEGISLSSDPGTVTYTFVTGATTSGPVKMNLTSGSFDVSAAFAVNSDASIYTINGGTNKTGLRGNAITITSGKELTIGSSSESTDTGTIEIYAPISGGQALNIRRGAASSEVILNTANTSFAGTVNIYQGVLTINVVDAVGSNNAVVISENGTLKLGAMSSATIQTLSNAGTVNLNNKKLIISEGGSTLGKISNGSLQFNSNASFTLDDSAKLTDVDIILNGATMTIGANQTLTSVQTVSGATGAVSIANGKTLTLTDAANFSTGITYKSAASNGGTLIFDGGTSSASATFTTGSSAQFATATGNLVNVQVNQYSTLALGAAETVADLTLNNGNVSLGNYALTVSGGNITSSGTSAVSLGSNNTGSLKLGAATNVTGSDTLTVDSLDLNSKTVSLTADKDKTFTLKAKALSNAAAIAINRGTTLDVSSISGGLNTSAALYGYNAGTLKGDLTYTGKGVMTIKDGMFNVTGNAKFATGNKITMDMEQGTSSQGMPGLNVGGKLIFNTDATAAIKSDSAAMSTVTLSGYRSGESLTININTEDGIYGYGSGQGAALETVAKKNIAVDSGKGYIVYDSGTNENYFKLLVDSSAGFDVNNITYKDGDMVVTLKARATSDNPIETVIVEGVNNGNESMTELYDKVNASSDRNGSLNQLNPYAVSAATANQMWVGQEYNSRTLQRLRMIRTALHGYGAVAPAGPDAFLASINPEVAYLAQSYGGRMYSPYGAAPGSAYACPPVYGMGMGCGYGCLPNQWWFRGIGAWEQQNEQDNLASYNATYAGFTIGVDRLYAPNFVMGLSAGGVWNKTNINDAGGSTAEGASFLINLYGSWFDNCNHLDFLFGYQGTTTDTNRYTDFGVDAMSGNYKSDAFLAAFELGHTYRFLTNSIEPYYGLEYINLQNKGFTESGSEGSLIVDDSNHQALLQSLGIRLMRSMSGHLKGYYFLPQFEVAWVHDYSDSGIITTSAFADSAESGSFVTYGYKVPRDRVKVAVGLDIVFNPATKIDIKYECQAGGGFGFHTLTGGFDWNF